MKAEREESQQRKQMEQTENRTQDDKFKSNRINIYIKCKWSIYVH